MKLVGSSEVSLETQRCVRWQPENQSRQAGRPWFWPAGVSHCHAWRRPCRDLVSMGSMTSTEPIIFLEEGSRTHQFLRKKTEESQYLDILNNILSISACKIFWNPLIEKTNIDTALSHGHISITLRAQRLCASCQQTTMDTVTVWMIEVAWYMKTDNPTQYVQRTLN